MILIKKRTRFEEARVGLLCVRCLCMEGGVVVVTFSLLFESRYHRHFHYCYIALHHHLLALFILFYISFPLLSICLIGVCCICSFSFLFSLPTVRSTFSFLPLFCGCNAIKWYIHHLHIITHHLPGSSFLLTLLLPSYFFLSPSAPTVALPLRFRYTYNNDDDDLTLFICLLHGAVYIYYVCMLNMYM